MAKGSPIGAHILKMISYVENLEKLDFLLSLELATNLIMQLLPQSHGQFVMNYNMNEIDKLLSELSSILRTTKQNLQKTKLETIMIVQKGKDKGKGKKKKDSKSKGKLKPKNVTLKPKDGVVKECKCFHYNDTGSDIRRETARFIYKI